MTSEWQIGVDLGGTKTEVILMDSASREHFRMRLPTPHGDYQGTLATIERLVHEAEFHAGCSGLPVGWGSPVQSPG